MLTVHLLGHVYVSVGGLPLRLSLKATALITYLALERQPQHREVMADLLWPSCAALANLRVELSKLRATGLDLGPARSPLLSTEATTDEQLFLTLPSQADAGATTAWLGLLRGTPLSGLEDAGTTSFGLWLDGQRQRLGDLSEERLEAAHTRAQAAGHWHQATAILRRAGGLGQQWPAGVRLGSGLLQAAPTIQEPRHASQSPHPASQLPHRTSQLRPHRPSLGLLGAELSGGRVTGLDAGPDTNLDAGRAGLSASPVSPYTDALRVVGAALRASVSRPQLLLISGLSGHRWKLIAQMIRSEDRWLNLRLETVSSTQMLLASVAMQLLPQVPAGLQAELRGTLQQPCDPETLLVRLGSVVMACDQPLLLVLNSAESLPAGVFVLLEYLMNWPMQALVVLIGSADAAPRLLRQLHANLPSERLHHVGLPRLTPAALSQLSEILGRLPGQAAGPIQLPDPFQEVAPLQDTVLVQNTVLFQNTVTAEQPEPVHSRAHSDPAAPDHLRLLLAVQQSEGWPLAAAELLRGAQDADGTGDANGGGAVAPGHHRRMTLSEPLRRTLIAQVDSVMPEQRLLLARLAALPSPFSLDSAIAALGSQAREASLTASAEGFLECVPPVIRLDLPSLDWRTPDGEYPLAFASELRRAALAGSLPQDERQRLRSFGRLSGLAPEVLSGRPPTLGRTGLETGSGAERLPLRPDRRPGPPAASRSVWLPGGYHVILEDGVMHVLRLSWGDAPTLQMTWTPADPAARTANRTADDQTGCEWCLTARIDAFAGTAPEFALQVQCGDQRETLDARPAAAGQWLTFCGRSDQPFGSLNVRASDLVLTLGGVWIGGEPVFPGRLAGTETLTQVKAETPVC